MALQFPFTTSLESPSLPGSSVAWPPKRDILGVQVTAAPYDDVLDAIFAAAHERSPAIASFFAVHAVVTAATTPQLLGEVNQFDVVAPDGQPVRWLLNGLYRCRLPDRVAGTETMWRACRRAAEEGVPIYLYGATPETLAALEKRLKEAFPALKIAGAESPPFRPLTAAEDEAVVRRVNESGAGIMFLGLGCPKQDYFAAAHRGRIRAVQMCVGAAFDFHARRIRVAPRWMQRAGLEWLFRLCQEPKRLWKRYLTTNSVFIALALRQWWKMTMPDIPWRAKSPLEWSPEHASHT